jgi:hypothetical protein
MRSLSVGLGYHGIIVAGNGIRSPRPAGTLWTGLGSFDVAKISAVFGTFSVISDFWSPVVPQFRDSGKPETRSES